MGLYTIFLILLSNLLTAMIVTTIYYITNTPSPQANRIQRSSRVFFPKWSTNDSSSVSDFTILSYFNTAIPTDILRHIDTNSSLKVIHTNCSLPPKEDCSHVQFEALLNLADRTICKCEKSKLSLVNSCVKGQKLDNLMRPATSEYDNVAVFAVTPTYTRLTQKVDLTSLCYTIQNVPNIIWIVIEDSIHKTKLVSDVLQRCKVKSVHLNVKTSRVYRALRSRGVEQRNTGLDWIRTHCVTPKTKPECLRGVLYFMDDDNKYDLRLFEEMKKTVGVSVFPVGFAGGLKFEGPVCRNGTALKWQAHYAPERTFPMDMAGFVINITKFLSKPGVKMGFTTVEGRTRPVKDGHLETDYLEEFASRKTVECRGSETEVFVWHVKTLKPPIPYERKHPSDSKVEV